MDSSEGNINLLLFSSSLLFLMAPTIAIVNSVSVRPCNRISTILTLLITISVAYVLFYVVGYSLIFSEEGSVFVGNFSDCMLLKTIRDGFSAQRVANFLKQLSDIGLVVVILIGGTVERTHLKGLLAYVVLWLPFVYCIPVYWMEGANGWIGAWGALQYSCGVANVVIASSVLVYSIFVGKRAKTDESARNEKGETTMAFLMTFLIWFSWIGFNAPNAGGPNSRALLSVINMHLAAVTASLSTALSNRLLFKENAYNSAMYCKGLIAGLVAVSPAAGYIQPHYSFVFGVLTGLVCAVTIRAKDWCHLDEPCGVVEMQGTSSILGLLLTAFFAQSNVASLSGEVVMGGFIDHHYAQFHIQLLATMAVVGWALVTTAILCFVLMKIPWLEFKINEEEQLIGYDKLKLDINY